MPDLVHSLDIPYPVAVDTRGLTERAYFVDSHPDFYIIDRSGRVRIADLMDFELERAIELVLSEEPARGIGPGRETGNEETGMNGRGESTGGSDL